MNIKEWCIENIPIIVMVVMLAVIFVIGFLLGYYAGCNPEEWWTATNMTGIN